MPWNGGLGTELMSLVWGIRHMPAAKPARAISRLSVGRGPAPIPGMGTLRSDGAEPQRGWDGERVSTELELLRMGVLDPM